MKWCSPVLFLWIAVLNLACDGMGSGPQEAESTALTRVRQHGDGWTRVPQNSSTLWRDSQETEPPLPNARFVRTSAGTLQLDPDGTYALRFLLEYATSDFEMLATERVVEGVFERHGNLFRFDPDRGPCDGASVFGRAQEAALTLYLGTESSRPADWAHHGLVSRLEFEPISLRSGNEMHNSSYEVVARREDEHCLVSALPYEAGAAGFGGYRQQRLEAVTMRFAQRASISAEWTEYNLGGTPPDAKESLSFGLSVDYEFAGSLVYFALPMDSFGFLDGDKMVVHQVPLMDASSRPTRPRRVLPLSLRLASN